MKNKGTDDLDKEFESDDELYASYDAYKALLEAGVAQKDALKRTGLTAQIVKDLEAEEDVEEDDDDRDLKDSWYSDEDDDEGSWKDDDNFDGDVEDWDDADADLSDDYDDAGGGADWDDRY